MNIMARLGGNPADLEAVGRLFDHGNTRIAKDSEGFYLTSPELDAVADGGVQLQEVAQVLVRHVNGVGRVLLPGFEPVSAEGRFDRFAADGSKTTEIVLTVDSIVMRQTVGTPTLSVNGLVVQPPPSPAPGWVDLARTNPDVRDILGYLGRPEGDLDWFDLWKIWEVVREDVGGLGAVAAKGWASEDDLQAFRVSANDPTISGDAARHARQHQHVAVKVLSLHEGRALVRQVAEAWLRSL
jgi:hypothetical protein